MSAGAVPIEQVTREDFDNPDLFVDKLNRILLLMMQAINQHQGVAGAIPLEADLNMQGHNIVNVGPTKKTL